MPTARSATTFSVPPQNTDSAISHWLTPHQVAVPQGEARRNQLFLFLSGSFGTPDNQSLLFKEAVQAGYHAINLCYPNSWTVAALCRRSSDPDCHGKVRLSIIDGHSHSNLIEIDRANSIENRLAKLLVYLQQHRPHEHWGTYCEKGEICWENIAIAGHSQGGGHAVLIAKQHLVVRCIMFAAPADFSPVLQRPSPWLSSPQATPAERYYGFAHAQDKGLNYILLAWEQLGLAQFGSAINVDKTSNPYNQSHQLLTNSMPARPGKYHGCVVLDLQTPKSSDRTPLLRPVWQYLLG